MKTQKKPKTIFGQKDEVELEVTPKTTLNLRLVRVMRSFQASNNADTKKIIKRAEFSD